MAAAVGSRVGGPGRDGFSVHIFSPHLLVVVWHSVGMFEQEGLAPTVC